MPYLGNYTGAPSVEPDSGLKMPFLRDTSSPEAFGVNVAQSQQNLASKLGIAASTAGDWAEKLQGQYNDAALADMDNKFNKITGPKTAEYMQLSGQDAVRAQPAYQQFLDDTKTQLMSQAPNAAVARAANIRLNRSATDLSVNGYKHSVVQLDSWKKSEQDAGIGISKDKAGQNTDDEDAFLQSQAETQMRVEQRYASSGFDAKSEATQLAVKKELSDGWNNRLTSLVQQGKADQAMNEYTAHRNDILDPMDKIHDSIYTGQTSQWTKNKAIKLTAGMGTVDGLVNSIYGQESSSGKNAITSPDGARGGMQIMPATFKRFAKPGEEIDNPEDNMAVGRRIIETYWQKYNGDAQRVAVAYFSGEGNVAPEGSSKPYKNNYKDGGGVLVSTYVDQVMSRMGGVSAQVADPAGIQKAVNQARIDAVAAFPNDPNIADQAEAAVRIRFGQAKQDINNAKTESIYKARDYIYARTDADPQATPLTWEEHMENPDFKASIDYLYTQPDGMREVAKLQGLVKRNILNVPDSPERTERNEMLQGMADSDPRRFMKQDLTGLDLTRQQANDLHKLQRKMTDVSKGDPNLVHWTSFLDKTGFFRDAQMLPATDTRPNPDYDKFIGQLNTQLKKLQADGKKPDETQVKKLAAMLMTNISEGKTVPAGSGTPFYKSPVPDEDRAAIIKQYQEKQNATPSEQTIKEIYNNYIYRRALLNPDPRLRT